MVDSESTLSYSYPKKEFGLSDSSKTNSSLLDQSDPIQKRKKRGKKLVSLSVPSGRGTKVLLSDPLPSRNHVQYPPLFPSQVNVPHTSSEANYAIWLDGFEIYRLYSRDTPVSFDKQGTGITGRSGTIEIRIGDSPQSTAISWKTLRRPSKSTIDDLWKSNEMYLSSISKFKRQLLYMFSTTTPRDLNLHVRVVESDATTRYFVDKISQALNYAGMFAAMFRTSSAEAASTALQVVSNAASCCVNLFDDDVELEYGGSLSISSLNDESVSAWSFQLSRFNHTNPQRTGAQSPGGIEEPVFLKSHQTNDLLSKAERIVLPFLLPDIRLHFIIQKQYIDRHLFQKPKYMEIRLREIKFSPNFFEATLQKNHLFLSFSFGASELLRFSSWSIPLNATAKLPSIFGLTNYIVWSGMWSPDCPLPYSLSFSKCSGDTDTVTLFNSILGPTTAPLTPPTTNKNEIPSGTFQHPTQFISEFIPFHHSNLRKSHFIFPNQQETHLIYLGDFKSKFRSEIQFRVLLY
jgi:hypothetical protein